MIQLPVFTNLKFYAFFFSTKLFPKVSSVFNDFYQHFNFKYSKNFLNNGF